MIRRLPAVYRAKFRSELALQLAYRWAILIWLLGLILEPTVSLVVWRTVADSQGGSVAGFAAGDFAAYFAVLMIVNQLTFTWHFGFFSYRVREGYFSPLLLRPVHPVHNDVAENLTFKLMTFTVVIPVAIFLIVSFGARFATDASHLVAAIPAIGLAMVLRFLVEWTLGTAAFWLTRTSALNQAYYVVMLFLSGQVAPLTLLPGAIQAIATILPFRWMVAFPVDVALGRLPMSDVLSGLAMQLVWIGVAVIVLRTAWRAGIRRYSAVGA